MGNRNFQLITSIFLILILAGCKNGEEPSLTTSEVIDITFTMATCGGNIIDDGNSKVTEKGVCWATHPNPIVENIDQNKTIEHGKSDSFTSRLTLLAPNTKYYVKAFATNRTGTGYGNEISFTTGTTPVPIVLTSELTSITQSTALSGGNVTEIAGVTVTEKGICWARGQFNPARVVKYPNTFDGYVPNGSGSGGFKSSLINLKGGTKYYVWAYAIYDESIENSKGRIEYGNQVSFISGTGPPIISTSQFYDIRTSSVSCELKISNDGGEKITNYGLCLSITADPTIDNNIYSSGSYDYSYMNSTTVSHIRGLIPNTTYYVRAFASNALGTGYGQQFSFTTLPLDTIIRFNPDLTYGTVNDSEGNIYKTIQIGTQVWMAENLRATRYRNGDLIDKTSTVDISTESAPAYQWAYDNWEGYVPVYGRLYTWYAVTDNRSVCPVGWHLPSKTEWSTLALFLGGESIAGKKLKEKGTVHWRDIVNNTNESGFTALPGGIRYVNQFNHIESNGYWWTDEPYSSSHGNAILITDQRIVKEINLKNSSLSVRCVKD